MAEKQEKKTLNLYQKLLEIRRSVDYLKKEAQGHRYVYVKESQVLAAIRPKMDELGVFLELEMTKSELVNDLLNVEFTFTWVDCDDPAQRIEKKMHMQCQPGDPKLVGGLLSYCNRYFLTKTFQIPTDDLDIDAFQAKTLNATVKTKPLITDDQVQELELKINGNADLRKQILQHIPGKSLTNLTTDRYQAVLNWIEKVQKGDNNAN